METRSDDNPHFADEEPEASLIPRPNIMTPNKQKVFTSACVLCGLHCARRLFRPPHDAVVHPISQKRKLRPPNRSKSLHQDMAGSDTSPQPQCQLVLTVQGMPNAQFWAGTWSPELFSTDVLLRTAPGADTTVHREGRAPAQPNFIHSSTKLGRPATQRPQGDKAWGTQARVQGHTAPRSRELNVTKPHALNCTATEGTRERFIETQPDDERDTERQRPKERQKQREKDRETE